MLIAMTARTRWTLFAISLAVYFALFMLAQEILDHVDSLIVRLLISGALIGIPTVISIEAFYKARSSRTADRV